MDLKQDFSTQNNNEDKIIYTSSLSDNADNNPSINNYGAKLMAGVRSVATKLDVILLYIGVILATFVTSLEVNLRYTLLPSALNEFHVTSISSVINVVVALLGVLLIPLISKAVDYFGRNEFMLISIIVFFVGLIATSFSNSFTTLSAGYLIISMGEIGFNTIKAILIADITSLANRAIVMAIDGVPFVINTVVGTLAATPIDTSLGWRWAFGFPAIFIIPFTFLFLFMLFRLQYRAINTLEPSFFGTKYSFREKIELVLKDLDFVGLLLLLASATCILVPINIAASLPQKWNSPVVIALEIVGGVLLIGLIIWEAKYSKIPLVPLRLFSNPTSAGAFIFVFCVAIDAGMNWVYLSVYFMISRRIGFTEVNLLLKGYQISYMVSALVTGLLVKKFNDYRILLIIGAALNCIGLGLMIPARFPHSSDAFIVITQAITGIGSGIVDLCVIIAYQGAVARKDVAIATASAFIIKNIGNSIGGTIAGGVWTNIVPRLLRESLGDNFNVQRAMDEFTYVQSLQGEEYEKAITSFGNGQMYITMISTILAGIAFLFALFIMKPIKVNEVQKFDGKIDDREDN